ncbi:MAG TPA: DUF779 domain-containing protein [Gaiellaceae bacterium]|nr:DUF779 domain-containing protein [Gaiellaceae bacterium]
MQADTSSRIVATDAAVAEIGRLKAEHGSLMFFQSGGCCDGSSPMCFADGELLVGPNDVLLGHVEGCPFYIDVEQYERWNRPRLVLDVATGAGSGMSLEEAHGLHFAVGSPEAEACDVRLPASSRA